MASRRRASRRRTSRRRAARIAVPGLLFATAFAFLPAGGAAAESGECEWRPHTVRVVKHVKRHGRRVKVVRRRVRWSCVAVGPAPAAPPASPAAPPAPPVVTAPPPPAEEADNPHYLGAQAYEYGFTPTKPAFELQAGSDTIELINQGEDAHDLNLESLATHAKVLELGATASGGHARGTAVLEPGEYRLFCSLADHAERGMERILVVAP